MVRTILFVINLQSSFLSAGDGGSFPECHVAQYPLDMGKKKVRLADICPFLCLSQYFRHPLETP